MANWFIGVAWKSFGISGTCEPIDLEIPIEILSDVFARLARLYNSLNIQNAIKFDGIPIDSHRARPDVFSGHVCSKVVCWFQLY